MATFIGTTKYRIDGEYTSSGDLTTPLEQLAIAKDQELGNGTGANQANAFFSDSDNLVGESVNLDLFGGLTDAFGTTLNFVKIRELVIHNLSTVSGEVLTLSGNFLTTDVLGGAAPTVIVEPKGHFRVSSPVDGYDVTNATADVITIDSGSDTIAYDIIIIGTV